MINLQSSDEGSRNDIVIAFINQGHLALDMTDVALESFSFFHSDRKCCVQINNLLRNP